MDLVGSLRSKSHKITTQNELLELYPHDLQMYKIPPTSEILLSEFEELAVQRLHLLRIIEQASQKGHKYFSDDWIQCILTDLKKENLNNFHRLIMFCGSSDTEAHIVARRADHVSHFILRLAYCRSEELRKWFLARELEYFKLKFLKMSNNADLEKFLNINNLTYPPISSEEKSELREELYCSTPNVNDVEGTDFYKVRFTEVPYLVKRRRVFLKRGFAYVPRIELVTLISNIFRTQLSHALVYANQKLPRLDDERVNKLLSILHTTYTGRTFNTTSEDSTALDPSLMDTYSKKNFPLCMRNIHENFRSTHTLKHGCRLQYGFFCKAIGLSYEDCVTFWREEMTKLIDANDFEKRYAYAIKHNYGKAGRMINYSPYSCMKIIMGNVGAGDIHGCPYKLWDNGYLKQKLNDYGISGQGVEEIAGLAKEGHYQLACSKYFEYLHGKPSKELISHPNQYFEESVNLKNENNQIATPARNKFARNPDQTPDSQ